MLNDVTGIVVSYNNKNILNDCLNSVRKFYKELKIHIIDGSEEGNECRDFVKSLHGTNNYKISLAQGNIGHGRGLDYCLQKCDTKYAFIFDSDIVMIKPPIEKMLKQIGNDYGIGEIQIVDYLGLNVKRNQGFKYLHPYCCLINVSKYKDNKPFIHHGAPFINAMYNLYVNDKSDELKSFDDIKKYIKHEFYGTRDKNEVPHYGVGYGIGKWEKPSTTLNKKDIKVGLAISTFFRKDGIERFENVFKKSISSLLNSNFNGKIFLIDDCSEIDDHLQWIEKNDINKRINIIRKKKNGGISKCKNTGIKHLMKIGCDIMFLADDDIEYLKEGWDKLYIDAMIDTNIHHFSYYYNYADEESIEKVVEDKKINNTHVYKTAGLNGVLLSFTRDCIKQCGYFYDFPNKYGMEHVEFTNRIMFKKLCPFWCDLKDSHQYITLIKESKTLCSNDTIKDKKLIDENIKICWSTDKNTIYECIE